MSKKYYWIKLKTDFFNQEEIDFLMSQKNGSEYVVLYQMLCLKTANSNGEMASKMGEMIIKYDVEKIQRETKYFSIDTISMALNLFASLNLIYKQENDIFKITNHEKLVGSESIWADKKRKHLANKLPQLENVKRLNREMIRLNNGDTKYIDEKRYGGNGALVYDLANCICEICGNDDSKSLVIHHNNDYSNEIEDLYLLCKKCHANVEAGNIEAKHNRYSGNCPPNVPHKSIELDLDIRVLEKDKEKDKENTKNINTIVDYLNEKTSKRFNPKTKKHQEHINARLKEGYTVEDFKKVIDNKCEDWLSDDKMKKYLQPSTLFSLSHFDEYLNQENKKEVLNEKDSVDRFGVRWV